jgi:hypothetical protein
MPVLITLKPFKTLVDVIVGVVVTTLIVVGSRLKRRITNDC